VACLQWEPDHNLCFLNTTVKQWLILSRGGLHTPNSPENAALLIIFSHEPAAALVGL